MTTTTDYFNFLDQPDFDLLYPDVRAVLDFWFNRAGEPYWFIADKNFDQQIGDKFGTVWQAACQGELAHWRRDEEQKDNALVTLAGRLAEIIVLDQFSRNLSRGQAVAFSQDNMALVLAQEAIYQPRFDSLPWQWRQFMIMPFMHSESAVIHEHYLPLFEQLEDANTLDFAQNHQAIIEQFGRYPQRNIALNRKSTAEENIFLEQSNLSF